MILCIVIGVEPNDVLEIQQNNNNSHFMNSLRKSTRQFLEMTFTELGRFCANRPWIVLFLGNLKWLFIVKNSLYQIYLNK